MSCPDVNSFPHLAEILNVSLDELMQGKAEPIEKRKGRNEIVSIVFKGVALAMGITVVVLSVLNELDTRTGIIMLGLGLTSISIYCLQEKNNR